MRYDVYLTDDSPNDPHARETHHRLEDEDLFDQLDADGYEWDEGLRCYVDEDGRPLDAAVMYSVAVRVAQEGGGRQIRHAVW